MGSYLWLLAGTAWAASVSSLPVNASQPSGGATDLKTAAASVATYALNIFLLVAGISAVFYLVWAALQYITSAGNPEKAKAGREGVRHAFMGIVIIVCAYGVVSLGIELSKAIIGS